MAQLIQITENLTVRFIQEENMSWFLLSDICSVLDCSKSSIRSFVNSTYIILRKIPDKLGRQFSQMFINTEGIKQIYQKSRSMKIPILMNGLSHFITEPNQVVYACKEVSWLRIIQTAFSSLKSELQYPIGDYRIDLYFPDLLIALECDENGHSDRSLEQEKTREQYISQQLKCQFIRFNPDTTHFNIGDIINKIFRIFCIRQKVTTDIILPPPPKSKRLLRELTDKPCYTCKIVKPLEDFHNARENRDGRENICKICREIRQKEIVEEKKKSLPENYIEKECSVCKEIKPLANFFRDKQKWDGYALKCKVCWKERNQVLKEKPKLQIIEKACTCCSLTKSIEEFYRRKASPDGFSIYCKNCAKNKAKTQYDTNHEKYLENKRKYRKETFNT
jgi:very-short-patch-repair endonuclease